MSQPRGRAHPEGIQLEKKLETAWGWEGLEQHKHPLCANPGREWEVGEEEMQGACLPIQEQLHNLGTAVQCWEKRGENRKNVDCLWVWGVVFLHVQVVESLG